jgi:HSP20 family protein
MTLTRRPYPVPELPTLRETIDRLFDESFVRPSLWVTPRYEGVFAPPIDVYATKDEFIVRMALPGIKPEEVETTIEGDTLTIHGTFEHKEGIEDVGYLTRELARGEFRRSIVLPVGLRLDAAQAVFEHGILTLRIPKLEEIKPRRIEVKAR